MNAATEKMMEVLRARDWSFDVDEDAEMVNTGCNGKNGQWRIRAGAINNCSVLILSRFPVDCPEPKRPACAEVLTRINFGLPVAGFEMDYKDGRIYCKTGIPFGKELPPTELLDEALSFNLSVMDRYLPAIMQVIYSGTAPIKAVQDAEKPAKPKGKPDSDQPTLNAPPRFKLN